MGPARPKGLLRSYGEAPKPFPRPVFTPGIFYTSSGAHRGAKREDRRGGEESDDGSMRKVGGGRRQEEGGTQEIEEGGWA